MPTSISTAPLSQGSPPSSLIDYQPQSVPSSSSPPPPSTAAAAAAVVVAVPSSSSPVDLGLPSFTSTSSLITSDVPATTTTPSFTGSVIGSISRRNRRSFAALAREKTSNALANLSSIGSTTNSSLRQSASSGSLQKHSRKASQLSVGEISGFVPLSPPLSDGSGSSEQSSSAPFEPLSAVTEQPNPAAERRRQTIQLVPPISENIPVSPAKMHQTSSRLLRMTEDDRPFTKVIMRLAFLDEALVLGTLTDNCALP